MKVKLYKRFENWQKTGTVWIFSDPHFADEDGKLMNKNWPTPEEQVKIINSFVGKKDTLVCLGDVGDENFVKQLKGYKVLLTGNHDKGVSNYEKKYSVVLVDNPDTKDDERKGPVTIKEFNSYQEAETYKEEISAKDYLGIYRVIDNRLFDEVYEGPLFISNKILLSHEPIELGFGYNIHGHVHGGYKTDEDPNCPGFVKINVCADVVDYKPIRLDKLIEGYKVDDLHRITVDWATEKKLSKAKN